MADYPWPEPKVTYRRCRDYSEISPFRLPATGGQPELPPEINLADYWDYLNGIAFEAVQGARLGLRPPLRRFSVFLTDKCNLACDYCRVDRKNARSLDTAWLIGHLPAVRKLGAVFMDVMGLGEPTLVPHLPEVIQQAGRLGFVPTLGTNASTRVLEDEAYLARLLDVPAIKIRVSLDSAQAAAHDNQRGGQPTWRKAVRFIQHVVDLREKGRLRAGIFINKVVNRANIQDCLRDLRFFAALGVDDVHLIPIRRVPELYCSTDQIHQFNRETAPAIQQLAADHFFPWAARNAFIFGQAADEIALASQGIYYRPPLARQCYVMRGQLLLDACGHPYTCLWSKRNGGRSLVPELGASAAPADTWQGLADLNYPQINPSICQNLCTREIIQWNDRIEKSLGGIYETA
jgi:molybdenum cofactor biosynthesis enzyme MoaA